MRASLSLFFFLVSGIANAQVTFTHHLSWSQIKAKARQENKYIFLDVYTTWCQPCKMMDKEIFPQPAVGQFMNEHFLNVHVQFDTTAQDNAEVKAWYPDVHTINKIKEIQAFPTLLFFNPEGKLVHVSVGAPMLGEKMINTAKEAMDPQSQYITLKERYVKGERSPDLIQVLYKAAMHAQDMNVYYETANIYLHQQTNLLTPDVISVMLNATRHLTDTGFVLLQQHGAYIDSIQHKPVCTSLLNSIIFDDVLLPMLRKDGKKLEYAGGMVVYSGELIKPIDWQKIKAVLDQRFPLQSDSAIAYAKPIYQEWLK